MKRYKIAHRYVGSLGVEEDIRGEWVRWEDIKNLVAEKNKCRDANRFDQPHESQQEYKHG